MFHRTAAIMSLVLLVSMSMLLAQKVNVDWDSEADFAPYRTYGWAKGTPSENPLNHQRAVNAIENELAIKGFEQVDSNADLYITYHASSREDVNFYTTSYGYGYGPSWRWRYGGYGGSTSSNTRSYTVVKGSMVVDIWDAKEEKLLWRGVATATVNENPKPKNVEKKINNAVKKMFKQFPPKNKKK